MKKDIIVALLVSVYFFSFSNSIYAQASPFGINSNCTNIIKNGDFANGSNYWTLGSGWTVSSYAANNADFTNSVISQNIPFLNGDENGFVQLSLDLIVSQGGGSPSGPLTFNVELNGIVYATVHSMNGTTDQRTTVTYFNGASGNKVGNTNANGCDIGSICNNTLTGPYIFTGGWKIWIPVTPGSAVLGFRMIAGGGGSVDDIAFRNVKLMSCADFGDNPDSYGTTLPNAPIHGIKNTLRLGTELDGNADGLPALAGTSPTGDDNETSFNYALISGHATQSSDSNSYTSAGFANDNVYGAPSITLPGKYEWWMVDLGRPMQVGDIKIYNRLDCCKDNLSNSRVMLFNNIFTPVNTAAGLASAQATAVYNTQLGNMSGTSQVTVNAGNKTARYVLVQRTGNPSVSLDLDEVSVMAKPSDDEDGVTSFLPLNNVSGEVYNSYKVDLALANTSGTSANLCGWIDWNNNNTFEASEGVCTTVPNGATGASLIWPPSTLIVTPGDTGTYARFRITTNTLTVNNWIGVASDGEVEDYFVPIYSFVAVPLQLLNFTANKVGKDVLLKWQIAGEKNNKGFHVQYSNDGKTWQTLAFIPAVNSSDTGTNYSYIHHDYKTGINRYYRLLQVDLNGHVTISKVIELNLDKTDLFQISPNPVNDILHIESNRSAAITKMMLYNSAGKLLMEKVVGGYNAVLDFSGFRPGIYILKLSDDKGTFLCRKIVKE